MARISASISEELKDELYQAATEKDKAISHIVTEALRLYLDRSGSLGEVAGEKIENPGSLGLELRRLSEEVQSLRESLRVRTAPKRGVPFF